MNKKPFITIELIKYLKGLFPDTLPNRRGVSESDIAFYKDNKPS